MHGSGDVQHQARARRARARRHAQRGFRELDRHTHPNLGSGQAKFQGMPNLDAQSNEVVIATVELGTKHRTRTS